MTTYQPIKFCCQKISSSADMVDTVIFDQMSPHCDPELEDSKPILLNDTFVHNVASPYHVWLQKVQGMTRYRPDELSLEFWTSSVTLTVTTTVQSNFFHKTIHLMRMYHQTKFSCKRISSSDNKLKSHTLIILSLTVTLTLKMANQSFWKTIWFIMMHHHSKFGSERFSVSENIWTNIHWHFESLLWPWSWTQQSNFSIKHSGLW